MKFDLSDWIGRYWVQLWESQAKLVIVGLGDCFYIEGNCGAYQVKIKRFWRFWMVISRPTLEHLHYREKSKEFKNG